jgi:hypothetical protein
MIRPVQFLALIFVIPGAAWPASGTDAQGRYAFQLEPGKVHEICLRLEAGQKRSYEWSADAAVDFNIHYHRGDDVSYPVKRDATRAEKGTFTAKTGEDYCWMWTAKAATKVRGSIKN